MDEETPAQQRQRRLDLMRQKLTPISRERAQEISLRYLYEAMREHIDRDECVLDLFPPEFAEQIRKERNEGTVSDDWQVAIPADIRRRLDLQPGDKVKFTPLGGSKVLLEPVPRERGSGMLSDVSQLNDER